MKTFAEKLGALPTLDHLSTLQLVDGQGRTLGIIENKPGSQGSFRVYHYVASKWGGLGPEAAQEALELFAEHVADARLHPGKHPNIDRLFEILSLNRFYTVRVS